MSNGVNRASVWPATATSGLPPVNGHSQDGRACLKGAKTGSRQPYCMSTPRPSDLCGLYTKKAKVLSISQKAATVPIAYAAITSSRLTVR